MRYTLYIASAADDKRAAYSWLLANHAGIVDKGVYLTQGDRRFDESYSGHIAVQRALRAAARQEGVISLRLSLDTTMAEAVGFEILDAMPQPPLYPALCRTTKRITKRFNAFELASFKADEADASPQEIAVVDDAIDSLDQARTWAGTLRVWRDCLTRPTNIIR